MGDVMDERVSDQRKRGKVLFDIFLDLFLHSFNSNHIWNLLFEITEIIHHALPV